MLEHVIWRQGNPGQHLMPAHPHPASTWLKRTQNRSYKFDYAVVGLTVSLLVGWWMTKTLYTPPNSLCKHDHYDFLNHKFSIDYAWVLLCLIILTYSTSPNTLHICLSSWFLGRRKWIAEFKYAALYAQTAHLGITVITAHAVTVRYDWHDGASRLIVYVRVRNVTAN